ncbi:MAG: SusE domain-containing protein [Bacteroidaceae bacterium]|nr:SusE domain-containing protein [Bacteroidaceae bacterium]
MKKNIIMASMVMSLFLFASCATDRDDNPIVKKPTTFVLNQQAFGDNPIDLQSSSVVEFKALEQPDYGFPTQVNYGLQIALDNDFSDAEKVYNVDYTTNSTILRPNASDINMGILTLGGYTDASQVKTDAPTDIYVRLSAMLCNDMDSSSIVYSNVEKLRVYPYYVELKPAAPDFWWLIGGSIGDGTWTNSANNFASYKAVFPMSLVPEYEYDAKSGLGEIRATIYLEEGASLKLIHTIGDWNEQWGMVDGGFKKNDGGSGNITADKPGFYTITYNTLKDEVSMEAAPAPEKTFSKISIIGLNGDWETDIDMSPAAGAGANNHMWTAQITVTETAVFKFRADADWTVNWGYGSADGEVNLSGFGVQNGKNIGIEPGQYTIYLNDIDGYFLIVPFGK